MNKFGFSLMEVVLAILVIAVGATALFSLLPEGLDLGRKAQTENNVAILARSIISDVRVNGSYSTTLNTYSYLDPAERYEIIPGETNDVVLSLDTNLNFVVDYRVYMELNEVVPNELAEVHLTVFPGGYGTNDPIRFYSRFVNYH